MNHTFSTHRYTWLALGSLAALFALHTTWTVAAAAWIFPVLLLRFSRASSFRAAFAWLLPISLLLGGFWAAGTALLQPGLILLSVAILVVVTLVPFLLDRLLAHRLPPLLGTLVFPASRAACELLAVVVSQFGLVIGVLGTTQHAALPLAQLASVTGVYGISFVLCWAASVVNLLWQTGLSFAPAKRALVTFGLVLAVILGGGALRIGATDLPTTVPVAGIGPSREATEQRKAALSSIDSGGSFQDLLREHRAELVGAFRGVGDNLVEQTEREARAGAKIISWPEASMQVLEQDKPALLGRVADIAREHGAYVNVGALVYTDRAPNLVNEMTLVTPAGDTAWTYQKAHPTPMESADGLEPGEATMPVVRTEFGTLGGAICYDAEFTEFMRQGSRAGASLAVVPANDWREFEHHAELAVFRSIENGYSMLRQTDNGTSGVIDPLGRVQARVSSFDTPEPTVRGFVSNAPLWTPYRVVGDLFGWSCVAVALGLLGFGVLRHRRAAAGN